ncbi:Cytoplasmic glyoxalase II, partial [Tulasnella sp. 427]
MKVIPVPVRSDNYAYLLVDEQTKEAAAVDIYDVPKVTAKAKEENVKITSLLTTHHHQDHSGGNEAFASQNPSIKIYGGSSRCSAMTDEVKDGDVLKVGANITVKCMATPCHTQDSICFYVTDSQTSQKGVFTGDTLFIGGCGRFFEGTGAEMNKALSSLGTLPDETVTYPGHEYTASNFKFGISVEPDNEAIKKGIKLAQENKITTGLTTIADEKQFNVLMRLGSEAI